MNKSLNASERNYMMYMQWKIIHTIHTENVIMLYVIQKINSFRSLRGHQLKLMDAYTLLFSLFKRREGETVIYIKKRGSMYNTNNSISLSPCIACSEAMHRFG